MKHITIIILVFALNQLTSQTLKTKKISVFKDGHSFVQKQGTFTPSKNKLILTDLPNALFGTLWFDAPDISSIKSEQKEIQKAINKRVNNMNDLLHTLKGKQVTITLQNKQQLLVLVSDFIYALDGTIGLVHVKEVKNNKWITLHPNTIQYVSYDDAPAKEVKTTYQTLVSTVTIGFHNNNKKNLQMGFLQQGLSWTPSYRLKLLSETEALLVLNAEIKNDVEDYMMVDLDLVVGVPNFKFAHGPATLINFDVGSLGGRDYRSSDLLFSNQISTLGTNQRSTYNQPDLGSQEEDFHLYNLPNFSLKKGEREVSQLFQTKVPIKHTYVARLESTEEYYFSELENPNIPVYHKVKIINNSKHTFTTGPVFIVKEHNNTIQPLAQDIIKYTPPSHSVFADITQSPDIRMKVEEKVIDDNVTTKLFSGVTYKKITVEGTITVYNAKTKAINLEVFKDIHGEFIAASEKSEVNYKPINVNTNKKFSMNIEVTLIAKAEKKINYTYSKFIR